MMTLAAEQICARMKAELHYFRFLREEDIPLLARYLDCRKLKPEETLWLEGGECGFMVFIISGNLEIKKNTEFAGRQMIVGIYGRGSIAGELCLLDSSPRVVTAVACDEVELLILNRQNFDRFLIEHPESGVRLLKGMLMTVSTRLKKSFDRLAAIF
jgi:CRP-like cAMP-binding protein